MKSIKKKEKFYSLFLIASVIFTLIISRYTKSENFVLLLLLFDLFLFYKNSLYRNMILIHENNGYFYKLEKIDESLGLFFNRLMISSLITINLTGIILYLEINLILDFVKPLAVSFISAIFIYLIKEIFLKKESNFDFNYFKDSMKILIFEIFIIFMPNCLIYVLLCQIYHIHYTRFLLFLVIFTLYRLKPVIKKIEELKLSYNKSSNPK